MILDVLKKEIQGQKFPLLLLLILLMIKPQT